MIVRTMLSKTEHLGGGVYAGYDGYHVVVWIGGPTEAIEMRPDVAWALSDYMRRVIPMSNWRPVDTVPVGEGVLLYRETDLYPVSGWYAGDGLFCLEEGGPEDGEHRFAPFLKYAPTHWMPHPALPESQ